MRSLLLAVAVVFTVLETGACYGRSPAGVPVEIRNLSDRTLRDVPVTFGQVFKLDDFGRGVFVSADGDPIQAQVDVKRRHERGSIRFAIVSMVLDELPPNGSVKLLLKEGNERRDSAARVSLDQLVKTDFDASVTFRFPDGVERRVSFRDLVGDADAPPTTWLKGPVATEWCVSGPPTDKDAGPDPDLTVQFQVRTYRDGRLARVSMVVENCWDHWADNIRYDVTVEVGGKQVFCQNAVDHRRLSRWRKVFWWGGPKPPVHVVHDLDYMTSTGALPNYDTTLEIPPPTQSEQRLLRMEGPDWQILGRGALTAYMPTTGGRPEIASYPEWTVRYLLTMDPQRKALVLASGDLAGSWPIHVRVRETKRIMTIDQRPKFWLDARGTDRPEWKPPRHKPGADQVKLSPDLAHQGSVAYVPYLVTGDFYYLEEAYFWANYCLLATWYHPRRNEEGILSGQIRGNAWALRNIGDAAWIAPADHIDEVVYFDTKIRNNIADRIRRMYGPPEYSKLGFWGIRTTQDARIQKPANPRWMIIAPWEHDYLIWSLHHLVELGYAEAAKPRDFLLRWRVGMLTNEPDFDARMATPYRFVVGEKAADDKVTFYEDWKKLQQENARLYKPGMPSGGNSYAYSARAAIVCGIDGNYPKAKEAFERIENLLPDHRQVIAQQPFWPIAPRPGNRD